MRERLGSKKVFRRSGVIAIDGRVPASVLRSLPPAERPRKPVGLTRSVIDILGLAPYRAVRRHHPGIDRLSRWVERRVASQPGRAIGPRELLARARHWLPEIFEGIRIDWEALRARRDLETMDFEVEPPAEPASAREDEALDCLLAEKPERRARGLAILAEMGDPDLFDWCAMFLDDESTDVTVAALHTMLSCQDADPEVIAPFADSRDKRVRGAATAALAKHAGEGAPYWFERGLKDPEACVRLETAALLSEVDPAEHKVIFQLALYDPNPEIARRARKLAAGKGYPKKWYWAKTPKS